MSSVSALSSINIQLKFDHFWNSGIIIFDSCFCNWTTFDPLNVENELKLLVISKTKYARSTLLMFKMKSKFYSRLNQTMEDEMMQPSYLIPFDEIYLVLRLKRWKGIQITSCFKYKTVETFNPSFNKI